MYERFTDRARKLMAVANQKAQHFNHEKIESEHYLLALLSLGGSVGMVALENFYMDNKRDFDVKGMEDKIISRMKSGESVAIIGKIPQGETGKKIIEFALEAARSCGHSYVGTEHVLIALSREQNDSLAYTILKEDEIEHEKIKKAVIRFLGEENKPILPSCENCKVNIVCRKYKAIEDLASSLQTFGIRKYIEGIYKVISSECQLYRKVRI